MELRTGYKQTEVGLVPDEWSIEKLGNCLLAPPDYGINASAVEYSDHLPTYIRITDITDEGHFSRESITSVDHVDANRYLLSEGDLVFARTGASVGKSYLYNPEDGPLVYAGFLIRVKPDPHKLVPAYLAAYVQTAWYWNWVKIMSMRTGQPGINGREFAQLPFPCPSLVEQQAIAQALTDVNAQISSLDRLIAKKSNIMQGVMQQLLTGKMRLPGFDGDWQLKKLKSIAEIRMGRTPSRSNQHYWGPGSKWMSIADLKSKYIYQTNEEITPLASREMTVIPKGTLVMSFKLSIGKLAFTGDDMYSNEAICSFARLQADSQYLYYALSQMDLTIYGKQAVKGFTLNTDSLNSIEIPYPPPLEQKAIASILSDMDAEIEALEKQRNKTTALKQGMMQELLTGKTRLV